MWGSPLSFSSCSRFLCLLQTCSSWACRQQLRKICDLNLRHRVVYCWVLSGIIAFSSLLNMLVAVGWLKASPSKWKIFFSLFSLPSAADTWPPGICRAFSVQRQPAYRQSPGGHERPEQPWWLSAQSDCWSLGQTLSSDAFFDWIHCRNSRSCHI